MTLQTLKRVADDLRSLLADLDPDRLSGTDAARLLDGFAEIEKLASGGKLLAARRVESSNVWRRNGHRSAAAHVAEATGTALGPAINSLNTARQLQSLPTAEEAVRSGRLSEAQAREIAEAARLRPEAEGELVEAASRQPLSVLKVRCRRIKATGRDQLQAYVAVHRARYLRNWTESDGGVRFDAKLTPDEGARLIAVVRAETDRLAATARRTGSDEPRRALSADALVRLADRGSRPDPHPDREGSRSDEAPSAMVHVRVDHAALIRGSVEVGEVCEIPGVGPIPVEVARRLAVDSILSVLLTEGVDVATVAHAGRTIPASIKRALCERDPICVVPGCGEREGLEIDHVKPFAQGGLASLANLARLCHWHHYLKTHHRCTLEHTDDGWRWTLPDGARSSPDAFAGSG